MDPIVVEVPAAFKSVAVVLQHLLSLAEAARAHAATDLPFPCADLEHAFALGAGELHRALYAPVFAAMARQERTLWIGGVLHTRVAPSSTTFHSLAGDVPVTRWLYRPADKTCGPCVDPIAARLGAVRGTWLPATAAAMAFLVQQVPVREAEAIARRIQVLPYSDTSFHRVTLAFGARYAEHRDGIEETLIARYRIPSEATGLAVSLDRVATPMEEPRKRPRGRPRKGAPKRPVARVWRMAYCATVSLHDANGRTLHTLRYGATAASDPEEIVLALVGDVRALRKQRPDLGVCVLCDGAPELWGLLGSHFNEEALETAVRKLVDLWHLLEKVGKALRARYDEQRTAKELASWKLRLLTRSSAATELRDALRAWLAVPEDEPHGEGDVLKEAVGFLTRQLRAGRVDYAAARRAGQPVGSGAVEATCKSLFNVRFKRSGARWKDQNAGLLINLRAIHLSQRWDETVTLLHAAAEIEVRRAA